MDVIQGEGLGMMAKTKERYFEDAFDQHIVTSGGCANHLAVAQAALLPSWRTHAVHARPQTGHI
jgi:hypothetical protein